MGYADRAGAALTATGLVITCLTLYIILIILMILIIRDK